MGDPCNPMLNLALRKLIPALKPCFFCFDPMSQRTILGCRTLHPWPTWLDGIQVWRITWPIKMFQTKLLEKGKIVWGDVGCCTILLHDRFGSILLAFLSKW